MSYDMNQLLEICLNQGASDIHITVGRPPSFRIHGSIKSLKSEVLTADDTANLMKQITSERGQTEIAEAGSTDFAIGYFDKARFRVNVFKQKGRIAMVLRLIPSRILTFEQLGLPAHVKDLLTRPRGLILVTGPTGSGKSTTLATMIDFINSEEEMHIITIEDPIEYYHNHKKSVVNQRELHIDVPSFEDGLRRALREDPDVILVGEMRDLATISSAISAAETGHLVFGTLHTTGASRTVDRIIDVFPTNQQNQVRSGLSESLKGVVAQNLFKRIDQPGRCAALEILVCDAPIANLIREGKTHQVAGMMQVGKKKGNQPLDDAIMDLLRTGKISPEEAYEKSSDKKKFRALLKTPPDDLED